MLPLTIKEAFAKQVNSTYVWGGCPFRWDVKSSQLRLVSGRKYFKWLCSVGMSCGYVAFLLIRIIQFFFQNVPAKEYNLALFILMVCFFSLIFYFLLLRDPDDVVLFVNAAFKCFDQFETKFRKRGCEIELLFSVKVAGYLLLSMPLMLNAMAIGWAIIGGVWRYHNISLPSLIPESYRTSALTLVVSPLYGIFVFRLFITTGGAMITTVSCIVIVGIGYFQMEDQLR
jgi:hypothetical protein